MSYFEKLYVSKNERITINAPVQLVESAIIKDTMDSIVYLRNIFTNVSNDSIIAILINVVLYDITGELIKENNGILEYTYQDMEVSPGELYGNKVPIVLPDNTRKIEVAIKKVVKKSGEVIDYGSCDTVKPIEPRMISLPEDYLKSIDGNPYTPRVYPLTDEKYWQCTCGRINWIDNKECSICKRSDDQSEYGEEALKKSYDQYLERQEKERIKRQKQIEEERSKQEAERRKKEEEKRQAEIEETKIQEQLRMVQKKRRKTIIICLLCAAILVTGIVIAITVVIPNIRYNTAKEYMANGEYDKAIDTFESLNKEDYKEEYTECCYQKALALDSNGDYQKAKELFGSFDSYKDSRKFIELYGVMDSIEEKGLLDGFNDLSLLENNEKVKTYIEKELEMLCKEYCDNAEYYACIKACDSYGLINQYYYVSYYEQGNYYYNKGDYSEALRNYEKCNNYGDAEKKVTEIKPALTYEKAIKLAADAQIDEAMELFETIKDYKDSVEWIDACQTSKGKILRFGWFKNYRDGKIVQNTTDWDDRYMSVIKENDQFLICLNRANATLKPGESKTVQETYKTTIYDFSNPKMYIETETYYDVDGNVYQNSELVYRCVN